MGIPIEIPGLSAVLPEIPDGQLVVAESGPDPAKSFFVRGIALTALRDGRRVTFITSQGRDELLARLREEGRAQTSVDAYVENLEVHEREAIDRLEDLVVDGGFLAVDSFSFLTLDLSAVRLAALLRTLRGRCREKSTTALLGTDRGMFDPRSGAITDYLADGIIQFHAREIPEGMVRFLRVPKWTDGKFVDRNIHYDFDGARMAIDLRRRVR